MHKRTSKIHLAGHIAFHSTTAGPRPSAAPETWWRTMPPPVLNHVHRDALALVLGGRPGRGLQDDAAEAIGEALACVRTRTEGLTLDRAMTRVLHAALRGSDAAVAVLASVLRRRSRSDRAACALATAWQKKGAVPRGPRERAFSRAGNGA